MLRLSSSLLALVLFLGAFAPDAAAQWNRQRWTSGPEVMLGGGLNFCADNSDADCSGTDQGALLTGSLGYRFSPSFGLYVDADYGWLTPPSGIDESNTFDLFATARLFGAVSPHAELWGAAGWGYSRIMTEASGMNASWAGLGNAKFGVGGAIEVAPRMFIGAALDYIFRFSGTGETCISGNCAANDGDIQNAVHLSAFLKFRFQ